MRATDASPYITETLADAVSTNVEASSRAVDEYEKAARAQEGWQSLIDHKLIEWGRNLDQFRDDGIEPPTPEMIQRSIRLAEAFRDANCPSPMSVVPDANGGIVFERRERDVSEVLHLWDDGTIEYQRFRGTDLVERRPI